MKTLLRNLMITAFLVIFSSFVFAITQAQFNDAGTLLELGDTTNGFIVDGTADVYTSGDVNCVNLVNSGSITSTGAMTVSTLTVTGYESVAGTMSVTGAMATAAITSSGLVKASSGSFSGTVYSTGTITSGGALAGTTLDTGQGANELYDMDQNVLQASAVTFATVDTGQGANELYDMDQNVLTTDSPTFAGQTITYGIGMATANVTGLLTASSVSVSGTVYSTGTITSGGAIAGTTLDTGQGANELYDMDQNVLTTDSPTFAGQTITYGIGMATANVTGLLTASSGSFSGTVYSTGIITAATGLTVGKDELATSGYDFLQVGQGGYGGMASTGNSLITRIDKAAATGSPVIRLLSYTRNNADASYFVAGIVDVTKNAGANTSYMTFGTANGADATERMRIDNAGNVGISTTPTQALHVNGSVLIQTGNLLFNTTYQNIGDASNYVGTIHLSTLTYHSLLNIDGVVAENLIRGIKQGADGYLDKATMGIAYEKGGIKTKVREKSVIVRKPKKDIFGVIVKDKKGNIVEEEIIENVSEEYQVEEKDGMTLNVILSAMISVNQKLLERVDALNNRIIILENKPK